MSVLTIKDRLTKFQTLSEEFLQAVEPFCKNPSVLIGLEKSLNVLLKADEKIQERLKDPSMQGSDTIFYEYLEHDFTYLWVGLRQFKEPLLRRSSVITLEEARSSLIKFKSSFDSTFNPIPSLTNVINSIRGLDCF